MGSTSNVLRKLRNGSWSPRALKTFATNRLRVKNKDKKGAELYNRWREGIEANVKMPERRFPVVIEANTALSSPEQLKTVLNLPSIPEMLTTQTTSLKLESGDDETSSRGVNICAVNWKQINFLRNGWNSEEIVVWFNNQKRFAIRVLPKPVCEVKG
ncbi:hypothetical protein F4803DRAFT_524600 [Xylaria telfairii]|nr:hypothetical protein F4803DRAFT_524600 [Xylaria telfairii]